MKKITMTDADTVRFTGITAKIKFFSSMSMALLEKILAWVTLCEYGKGEKICSQGDPGDAFYAIESGAVSVKVKRGFLPFPKKMADLGPGDFFGEMALLSRQPRNATVTCEEPTRVFVLLADHFEAAAKENPKFAEEIRKLSDERKLELGHK
ncbi:MAG: cyclic nucleotide-binding protein [Elusimicrobia bacterium]|nr:MAG: cyclic nucleotide-binding protein [Elusimicrobiota bacterium]KAF0155247.1 MAG: cyclic nucleotide-binding protein [Elusimicrobiota bacterium]